MIFEIFLENTKGDDDSFLHILNMRKINAMMGHFLQ